MYKGEVFRRLRDTIKRLLAIVSSNCKLVARLQGCFATTGKHFLMTDNSLKREEGPYDGFKTTKIAQMLKTGYFVRFSFLTKLVLSFNALTGEVIPSTYF
jgi:hypothetical protein